MMKLILSLILIWTLSSTAEALKCMHGYGTDIKKQSCNSTDLCATVAYQAKISRRDVNDTLRTCLPSSLYSEGNHKYSVNVGFYAFFASVHVCNTDGCNDQPISYPGVQENNNLTCLTCNNESSAVCDKTVQCVGEQDRCISGTGVNKKGGGVFHASGCVSANLCKIAAKLELLPVDLPVTFRDAPECNSAWSVKLNVIPLLFGLITLIIY